MISLSIDRSSLGQLPLTLVDSGRAAGSYVITADGWFPGAVQADNDYARSKWINGAQLIASRVDLLTMQLAVRCWAASATAARQMADTLGAALLQDSYTITESGLSTTPVVYQCLPASWSMDWNPVELSQGTTLFTASIPRQP
jgi:hypothetical protein